MHPFKIYEVYLKYNTQDLKLIRSVHSRKSINPTKDKEVILSNANHLKIITEIIKFRKI